MKTGKVRAASYTGRTYETKYGTMHVHSVSFDNGDTGEYSSKSATQDKFVVGQQADYEFTPSNGTYPAKIKPVQQQNFKGGGKKYTDEEAKLASMSFSYAKDLAVAGKIQISEMPQYAQSFAKGIQELTERIKGNKPQQQPAPQQAQASDDDYNSDLPF